jgi:predicted dehydrogenase
MIRVGILGTGFGKFHGTLYQKISGFEIVSIFGRNLNKLSQIGKELNVQTTSNINDIVLNPDIDLLDICLPTELHSKWAIEGLRNNKHIFCETPLAYKVEEAEEIQATSKKYGKNVFVDMFYKYSIPHYTAIKYVKEGVLGNLVSIKSYNYTSPQWGDLGVKRNIENFHIHNVDFVNEVIKMPEKVVVSGLDFGVKSIVTTAYNVDDIHIVLESNSTMPNCCGFSLGFEFVFTNGAIWYGWKMGDYTKEEFYVYKNDNPAEKINLPLIDEYEEVFKDVLHCVNNNTKSEMLDIDAAVNTVKLMNMIVKSYENNK